MRLFSSKGKKLEDLDPAMFTKSKPGRAGKSRYIDRLNNLLYHSINGYSGPLKNRQGKIKKNSQNNRIKFRLI